MESPTQGNPLSNSVEASLRERVKELTCLCGIAQLAARPGISLDSILQGVALLLPSAWQHPDVASARIVFDGLEYRTPAFRGGKQRQAADVLVAGVRRGFVEVAYAEEKPELDEGPFLREERDLIDAVAGQIALILDRREAEEERARLESQLRHADRLATIGQLAAGVAHELSEPLGNILGFAQLAEKCPGLPKQAGDDIAKIELACLRAREAIGKLLAFSRETPPRRSSVDLNDLVREGMSFFQARLTRDGTDLVLDLARELPPITVDPGQINQVLVNLVVNALQAMPSGGRLAVRTRARNGSLSLSVEDTGVGIREDLLDKIHLPFFTTKDVGEGTGLGLPVVHGIVSAHGGKVNVESRLGEGSCFEVVLPLQDEGRG